MAKRVQGQASPAGTMKVARPLKVTRGTQRPTGPKMFRPGTKPQIITGPNMPPPGFLNGNNSISEWIVYFCLERMLGPESEGNWLYQGRIGGAGLPGGSKPDFVVFQEPPMAIRIQTERFHVAVNSAKQGYDDEQRIVLMRAGYNVIDLYEEQYIKDPTGAACFVLLTEALQGRQRPNPVRFHTSLARA